MKIKVLEDLLDKKDTELVNERKRNREEIKRNGLLEKELEITKIKVFSN
jgi:hypothetical protein